MPTASGVIFIKDFTGGLNLTAQAQNIEPNESPNCMNVDFGGRGGITSRLGWRRQATDADLSGAQIIGPFSGGTATENLYMIDNDGVLCYTNGSVDNFTTSATTVTDDIANSSVRMAVWGNTAYLANCRDTGAIEMKAIAHPATVTDLTNTANSNYAAPSGTNAPLARLIASHQGYMWWADTVESGTRYSSRVRFSHFNQPTNFATADYFDINPTGDDQITALVPFGSMLLCFKRQGVWAIYGSDRDNFTVEHLAGVAGTPSQEAVSYNAGVCYWWSNDGNVFAFNGSGVTPLGERIKGVVTLGIVSGDNSAARVNWAQGKLYVSLDGPEDMLLVYDPSVGQQGAWTRYDWPYRSAYWWRPAIGAPLLYFLRAGLGKLYSFGADIEFDNDTVATDIIAHYYSGWQDGGETATEKRFMRPRITTGAAGACELSVSAFMDFNLTVPHGLPQTLPMDSSVGGGLWGDAWGFLWSGSGSAIVEFERLQRLGKGHAVALYFTVTNPVGQWWIDSIAVPFKKKTIR